MSTISQHKLTALEAKVQALIETEAPNLVGDGYRLVAEVKLRVESRHSVTIKASAELILAEPLKSLGLSTKTHGNLQHSLPTIRMLARRSESQLYRLRGIGRKSLAEIKAKLAEHGLQLESRIPFNEEEVAEVRGKTAREFLYWCDRIDRYGNRLLREIAREEIDEAHVEQLCKVLGIPELDDRLFAPPSA